MRARILAVIAALLVPFACLPAPAPAASGPTLTYSAHVAGIGWLPDVTSPATAGTTGQSRQMEAIRIGTGLGLTYRAHVANIGWLPWVGPPFVAGTTGQARRMEALQIKLDPEIAVSWSVLCQAHVAGIGWLAPVADGATCGTTGQSRRMEAVRLWLVPRAPTDPTRLVVTADTGIDGNASAVLAAMGREGGSAWVLGDLAYADTSGIEQAYCDWLKARIPAGAQVIPGNHEAQNHDGEWARYAACLPDLWGVSGSYARGHWFVDKGPYRLIGISPGIVLPSGTLTYARGTVEREELKDWIDAGKAAGKWVIVGMHMPCMTVGVHGCASDATLTEMMIGKRVDLILSGHDHNYSRSHQVTGTPSAPVVVDRDGSFVAGAGSVLVTIGNGGHNPRTIGSASWVAAANGTNSTGGFSFGHLSITATSSQLSVTYTPDAGNLGVRDGFSITR